MKNLNSAIEQICGFLITVYSKDRDDMRLILFFFQIIAQMTRKTSYETILAVSC